MQISTIEDFNVESFNPNKIMAVTAKDSYFIAICGNFLLNEKSGICFKKNIPIRSFESYGIKVNDFHIWKLETENLFHLEIDFELDFKKVLEDKELFFWDLRRTFMSAVDVDFEGLERTTPVNVDYIFRDTHPDDLECDQLAKALVVQIMLNGNYSFEIIKENGGTVISVEEK